MTQVYVGIDLASGPDVTAYWTRNRKGLIEMRGQPTPYKETLSIDACRAIYTKLIEFDSLIEKQLSVRENAMAEIIEATDKINNAYKQRSELSAQLDKFAPDEFLKPDSSGAVNIEHAFANEAPRQLMPMPPVPPAPYAPAAETYSAAPSPYGYSPRPWHRKDPTLKAARRAPATSPARPWGESDEM